MQWILDFFRIWKHPCFLFTNIGKSGQNKAIHSALFACNLIREKEEERCVSPPLCFISETYPLGAASGGRTSERARKRADVYLPIHPSIDSLLIKTFARFQQGGQLAAFRRALFQSSLISRALLSPAILNSLDYTVDGFNRRTPIQRIPTPLCTESKPYAVCLHEIFELRSLLCFE